MRRNNAGEILTHWNDADPGLPEVSDARERVAGLRGGNRQSDIFSNHIVSILTFNIFEATL